MELFHEIEELDTAITGWHIHVKVVRSIKFLQTPQNKVLRLVLENERGQRIEAVVGHNLFDYYSTKIHEGTWITIMHFRVVSNMELIKAANHHLKIRFIENTIVKKSPYVYQNQFNQLTSLASILNDQINTSVLVDVIGAIVEVGELENISPNNDMCGFRLKFKLTDKDKNVMNCQAIGKEAVDFNFNYRILPPAVLIVVLRFWRVEREFTGPKNVKLCSNGLVSQVFPNPETEEAVEILHMLERDA